ncbi:hypothetical protein RUND412_007800 [Rhizina undulata]
MPKPPNSPSFEVEIESRSILNSDYASITDSNVNSFTGSQSDSLPKSYSEVVPGLKSSQAPIWNPPTPSIPTTPSNQSRTSSPAPILEMSAITAQETSPAFDLKLSEPPIPNPPPTRSQTRVPSPSQSPLPDPLPNKSNVRHENVATKIGHPAMVVLNLAFKGLSLMVNILGIFCLITLLFVADGIQGFWRADANKAIFKAAHVLGVEVSIALPRPSKILAIDLFEVQLPGTSDPDSSHSSLPSAYTAAVAKPSAKSDLAHESRPNYVITFEILPDSFDFREEHPLQRQHGRLPLEPALLVDAAATYPANPGRRAR